MEFKVAALAEAAGIGIDTVRFYQARGLIPSPERRGRFAIYGAEHLERIRKIRSLLDSGFSLAQIRQLLERDRAPGSTLPPDPSGKAAEAGSVGAVETSTLLEALAERRVGAGTLTRAELAEETGIPEALIASAVQSGLIQPIEIRGESRFPRSDLEMLHGALGILEMGMPLEGLLELAAEHAENVDRLVEKAIDLFDDHVRKPRAGDEEGVRAAFEKLLPQVTQIVALHFQRAIVARGLDRLRKSGDAGALEQALEATQAARLEVQWR